MDNNKGLEKGAETPISEAAPARPTTSTTRSPLRRLASQRARRDVPDDDAQHTGTEVEQGDKSLPPSGKEEEGGDGNAPKLSNLARYFWSRLDLAIDLFDNDRDDECRELILETLMRANVPIACRCELLQLLACVMPWKQAQDCLDEAEELCQEMEKLVPGSEQVMELRTQGAQYRQAIKEYHEIPDDDEPTQEEPGQGERQSC